MTLAAVDAALSHFHAGDAQESELRRRLVADHLSLASEIASRMLNRIPAGLTRDDLVSIGVLGLIDAARRYDLSTASNAGFRAYAAIRIRGAIVDHIRSRDLVPRSARDASREIEAAFRKLRSHLGRDPSDAEMAAELKTSEEEFRNRLEASRAAMAVGTEASLFDEEGEETSADTEQPDAFELVSRAELAGALQEVLKTLPESMRSVLTLYYYDELNYAEIAQVLGVTVSRVSQIHSAALLKMRARLHQSKIEKGVTT